MKRSINALVTKPNILPSIQHKDFVFQLKSLSHKELSAAIHSVHQELSRAYNPSSPRSGDQKRMKHL